MGQDYTDGKSFWKWYFSITKTWLFGIFANAFCVFGVYLIHMDGSPWHLYFVPPIPVVFLWVMTIREYRQLKNGIVK